jgi:small subunit ribosomal protein S17
MEKTAGQKSTKIGVVNGANMNKTVSVIVERQMRHPLYKKIVRVKKKFLVHDEYEKCKIGDMVKIVQSRPLSKLKRWRVLEIVSLSPSETAKEAKEKKG